MSLHPLPIVIASPTLPFKHEQQTFFILLTRTDVYTSGVARVMLVQGAF